MTPAEELRQAAAKIRETAAALVAHKDIRGSLDTAEWAEWFGPDAPVYLPEVNAWAALMSPALAEPLAAWLEWAADRHHKETADGADWCRYCAERWVCSELTRALAVARVITGGASA